MSIGAIDHNYKRMNELSKDAVSWLTVGEESAGQRIDNFLVRILKGVPKSHVYRILRTGEVRVNKGRVGAETRLASGDVVRVPPVRLAKLAATSRPVPKIASKALILYEDDAILAIDKPAGLAVHGGSGIAYGLIEQLRAARADARFLELVHRLDRDTSGVLLVAKKRAALAAPAGDLRALLARFGQADRDRLFAALYATTLPAFAAAQRAALAAPHCAFHSFTGRSSISWHRVLRFRYA